MNSIITIIKKELKRFFTDRRMLVTLFLPGILIFVLYSLMGNFIQDAFTESKDHEYNVYVENYDESLDDILACDDYKVTLTMVKDTDNYDIEKLIEEDNVDLYISFEKDFTSKLSDASSVPYVDMYYNSTNNESYAIYQYYYAKLMPASVNYTYNYTINMKENVKYDFATEEQASIQIITMMLPYLLIIFLFTGCLAISAESIAGEKERGTIASLLVTPVKRSNIAIGKILALSITALASSAVSFIGLIASLPKLFGSSGVTLDMYNASIYFEIFIIILITVILFTVILSIISTYARSVKEASQLASVVMFIVMMLGVSSMVGGGSVSTNPAVYLIPIYNCIQCMSGIFSLQFNLVNFVITIISNVVFIGLGVFALAKMFNSESIMFNK